LWGIIVAFDLPEKTQIPRPSTIGDGVSVLFDFDSGRYRWKSLGAENDLERLEEY